jgi:hypothetical protein
VPLGVLALVPAGVLMALSGPSDRRLERIEHEAGVRQQL